MTDSFEKQLKGEAALLGISLSPEQMEQFFLYGRLLVEWNQKMNLTAITEEGEIIRKHFVDSISLVKAFPGQLGEGELRLMDVGTGAGFPGIPLKILFPHWKVDLLDSLNKRIRFLEEVSGQLGLKGIRAFHGRAEDYGKNPQFRQGYDLCVSRAVANLSSLSEYCLPFVKTGGFFISYKSDEVEEELKAAKRAVSMLGGEIERVEKFSLPGGDDLRSLVVIRKVKATPEKYPRKAGLPSKEPLR